MPETPPSTCCSASAPPSRADRLRARLAALPPRASALVLLVLVVVGFLIGGPAGAVLIALVVAALLAILALSWTRLSVPERALRGAVLVFLVGLAVVRAFPR